ncbi:hypothetical protein D3C78_931060 [compost metagenome]
MAMSGAGSRREGCRRPASCTGRPCWTARHGVPVSVAARCPAGRVAHPALPGRPSSRCRNAAVPGGRVPTGPPGRCVELPVAGLASAGPRVRRPPRGRRSGWSARSWRRRYHGELRSAPGWHAGGHRRRSAGKPSARRPRPGCRNRTGRRVRRWQCPSWRSGQCAERRPHVPRRCWRWMLAGAVRRQ